MRQYINEAIGRFPFHPEIWYVTGNVRKEQGDYTDAIESYPRH